MHGYVTIYLQQASESFVLQFLLKGDLFDPKEQFHWNLRQLRGANQHSCCSFPLSNFPLSYWLQNPQINVIFYCNKRKVFAHNQIFESTALAFQNLEFFSSIVTFKCRFGEQIFRPNFLCWSPVRMSLIYKMRRFS